MYIHPTTIRKREKLTELLQVLKTAGYQVFMCRAEDYAYGIAEKDGHIIGINGAPYGTGLCLHYNYKPNREYGSGVGYGDQDWGYDYLTETDIRECIEYGAGYAMAHGLQRYQDVSEYMQHYDQYVPV